MGYLEAGIAVARETGLRFAGAALFGALAVAADNIDAREQALKDRETLLRGGSVSHNYLVFYRDAIELRSKARSGTAPYTMLALKRYTRLEPVPFAEFTIVRGRSLARHGRKVGIRGL